ncbi:MAG TPA: GTP cyclohydrolase FolE2 [Wenzhouxiangella sp.]|nr:GTP cyclohydrolase FolE2 [Wenzhouxiangella sp.]
MDKNLKPAEMPDVAADAKVQVAGRLDWVGMNSIELPVFLDGGDGERMQTSARVGAFVNLGRPDKRGIHMSRLYLHLHEALADHTLTPALLRHLLRDFLVSHEGLSTRALVRLDFDYMLSRKSLISDNYGWRRYPISLIASMDQDEFTVEMALQITYSSTCPCSGALARQLLQEEFGRDFGRNGEVDVESVIDWLGSEKGSTATPHSQRSAADVRLQLAPSFEAFPFVEMIDALEDALKTPVQAAVKREDEQAFARLNGQNMMFCEDAARRVQNELESQKRVTDYWVRCRHFESLHAHNAVAIVTKGVENGYMPIDGQPSGWRDN